MMFGHASNVAGSDMEYLGRRRAASSPATPRSPDLLRLSEVDSLASATPRGTPCGTPLGTPRGNGSKMLKEWSSSKSSVVSEASYRSTCGDDEFQARETLAEVFDKLMDTFEREEKVLRRGGGGARPLIFKFEAYECERYYPLIGWSKSLLPTDPGAFTDCGGNKVSAELFRKNNKPAFPLAKCINKGDNLWEWVDDEWTVSDYWYYHLDFHYFSARNVGKTTSSGAFVRRRQWARSCRLNPHSKVTSSCEMNDAYSSDCLAHLKERLSFCKEESTAYLIRTVREKDAEIRRLKRDLVVSKQRAQSVFKAATNAMKSSSSQHLLTKESSTFEQEQGEQTSPPQQHSSWTEEEKASQKRQEQEHANKCIVNELDRQFSNNSISIDEYVLSLTGMVQGASDASDL